MSQLIHQAISYSLMGIGAFFYFLAGLGLVRMPDLYTRLQASTKATTLGTFSLVLGVGILNPAFLGKSLLVILFVALTNPVASSVMMRAAYKCKLPTCKETCVDEISATENGGESI
ncbi:monovalent cation/H(+) antiporter subunit G [Fervidobacterium thailandense]|uniref:Cation:proton antiporter n=1 Tax=Fervidobacterium thailandense TaxID=1008305 RepID=A0A1E3G4T2_9BACT|nr:monovalent cation/H(+) antiporter subunit G [Fervidobacterium thailandense]ODN30658.1 cation:proton antiporter [Fervidobacterium thailandense]